MFLESLVYEVPQVLWQTEPQQALLPFIIGGAFLLVAILWVATTWGDTKEVKPVRGASLVILGMPSAGKTQFWKNLKGESYTAYETTNLVQEYKPFVYKSIRIDVGKEIGGDLRNVETYWENLMQDCDIALFIFDVSKYLNDTTYLEEANVRFDFFYRHLGEKDYAIIASHPDKVGKVKQGEETDLVKRVQSLMKGKVYSSLFQSNFFVRNLTDPQDFHIITEKLFANK